MSITAVSQPASPYVPFSFGDRPLVVRATAVVAATVLLALSSWISIPMVPVPITMQTFAVTVVGALFGWRLGAVAVLVWMAEGALGLPVLSGGTGGLSHFVGPAGGYLVAFPIAAALVGWCAERGLTTRSLGLSFALMAVANLLILGIGGAWLAQIIGVQKAVAHGVTPFLLGGMLKAGLATTSIEAARRHLRV